MMEEYTLKELKEQVRNLRDGFRKNQFFGGELRRQIETRLCFLDSICQEYSGTPFAIDETEFRKIIRESGDQRECHVMLSLLRSSYRILETLEKEKNLSSEGTESVLDAVRNLLELKNDLVDPRIRIKSKRITDS